MWNYMSEGVFFVHLHVASFELRLLFHLKYKILMVTSGKPEK